MTRFVVAITEGWRGDEPALARNDNRSRVIVPLSAHVYDRVYQDVVHTYRSDAAGWIYGSRGGLSTKVNGALNRAAVEMAREEAERLEHAYCNGN